MYKYNVKLSVSRQAGEPDESRYSGFLLIKTGGALTDVDTSTMLASTFEYDGEKLDIGREVNPSILGLKIKNQGTIVADGKRKQVKFSVASCEAATYTYTQAFYDLCDSFKKDPLKYKKTMLLAGTAATLCIIVAAHNADSCKSFISSLCSTIIKGLENASYNIRSFTR